MPVEDTIVPRQAPFLTKTRKNRCFPELKNVQNVAKLNQSLIFILGKRGNPKDIVKNVIIFKAENMQIDRKYEKKEEKEQENIDKHLNTRKNEKKDVKYMTKLPKGGKVGREEAEDILNVIQIGLEIGI